MVLRRGDVGAVVLMGWMVAAYLRPAEAVSSPPSFELDLDLPPALRWAGALEKVLSLHPWEYSFGPVFAAHNATLYNNVSAEQWAALGTAVEMHYPTTATELKSLAADFRDYEGQHVSYEYLCGWVYYHELAHTDLVASLAAIQPSTRECTGLVVQAGDGRVIHAANMDQSPEGVRNITLQVKFMRGGTVVAHGVDWHVVATFCRRQQFSLEAWWRCT
jgi:N-acylethanolamine-hydrolysing acid amidase